MSAHCTKLGNWMSSTKWTEWIYSAWAGVKSGGWERETSTGQKTYLLLSRYQQPTSTWLSTCSWQIICWSWHLVLAQVWPCAASQNQSQPFQHHIIVVYARMAEAEDREIEDFYQSLEEVYSCCHSNEIYSNDYGPLICKGRIRKRRGLISPFGIRERNERGDKLVDCCREKRMVVTNMWVKSIHRGGTCGWVPGIEWETKLTIS